MAFAWRVAVWLVLLTAAAAVVAAVVVPRLTGATPYTVQTGSMRPGHPPGSLVVVRALPVEEIRTGDVITFQTESGESAVVTHRVIEVGTNLDGEVQLVTKGDANGVADADPVQPVQVRGRVWYSVPYLGYVNNVIGGDERRVGLYLVVLGLLGYATSMFVTAARERRRFRHTVHQPNEEPSRDRTPA